MTWGGGDGLTDLAAQKCTVVDSKRTIMQYIKVMHTATNTLEHWIEQNDPWTHPSRISSPRALHTECG